MRRSLLLCMAYVGCGGWRQRVVNSAYTCAARVTSMASSAGGGDSGTSLAACKCSGGWRTCAAQAATIMTWWQWRGVVVAWRNQARQEGKRLPEEKRVAGGVALWRGGIDNDVVAGPA